MLITRLEHECKHTGMSIWRNVNVWIWKYNVMDMCTGYLLYENVVLGELYPYDAMIRKEHNY